MATLAETAAGAAAPDINLYALLESRFPASGCAIEVPGGASYSWDDLRQTTARMAHWLASLNLPQGSRVAVQVEKSPEALMLYLATLRAGFVYLPLNTAYRNDEISYFIGNAEPAVMVCSPANEAWIKPIAQAAGCEHVVTLGEAADGSLMTAVADRPTSFDTVAKSAHDLAAILYTSGTTGRSKGAMLSHGNLSSNALVLQQYWGWKQGDPQTGEGADVLLHALPIFHVHGLFVASHGALINGSTMIWLAKFDGSEVMRQLSRATVMMGVPTFYVRLLAEPTLSPQTCANMRLFISGSAPLLTETFTMFEQRTGHTILERYGMSETVMLTSNPYDGDRLGGTVGLPLPGVSLRVVDDQGQACPTGEIGGIEVKGPNVFSGYWRMPEKTAEEFTADGYFKTGDVGRIDERGYVAIVGRSKDLIITGGYNVYPKELELLIDDMPGVLESAVIGVPHPDFGEAVTAVVVPRAGASLNEAEMIAAIKPRIANYKVPKRIHVVAELPRNTMGKVQKNLLRQQFA